MGPSWVEIQTIRQNMRKASCSFDMWMFCFGTNQTKQFWIPFTNPQGPAVHSTATQQGPKGLPGKLAQDLPPSQFRSDPQFPSQARQNSHPGTREFRQGCQWILGEFVGEFLVNFGRKAWQKLPVKFLKIHGRLVWIFNPKQYQSIRTHVFPKTC